MREKPLYESYKKKKSKAILFFSSASTGDIAQLKKFGINEILVSYHYIRKSMPFYNDFIKGVKQDGGLFMIDSGAFSFMGDRNEDMRKEKFWETYINEYLQWVYDNCDNLFCIANLDIDKIIGRKIVDKWNRQYFEPLEKLTNVIYVAHEEKGDPHAISHFRDYCQEHGYVGINKTHKDYAAKFYQIAQETNTRVHGFAWTEFSMVKQFPFFSVDSSTWLGGARYGTTYDFDGKTFRTLDYSKKYVRKRRKESVEKLGIPFDEVYGDNEYRYSVNRMNLLGWMGFRQEYLKMANLKLKNKYVYEYEVGR